jgi:dTDP-4-dehydrorhamnose 3,5-epimerase
MIFRETHLVGAFLIRLEKMEDERGYFARSFCEKEFARHNLSLPVVQCNVSFNRAKGTLRGMHYQAAPHEEAKLVRCTRGALYDVIIDLRPDSETYKDYCAEELTDTNGKMLYVPEGFAHGFVTLADNTEVFYQMSTHYAPEYARGVRYDDPAFGIEWPCSIGCVSEKDRGYPDFMDEGSAP